MGKKISPLGQLIAGLKQAILFFSPLIILFLLVFTILKALSPQ